MKIKLLSVIIVCVAILLSSCSSTGKSGKETTGDKDSINKPWNISIYLDLSDRLIRDMAPSQKDKDIQIVNYMTEILKNHSVAQKILPSRDRIKVFFYPAPKGPKISLLSNDLEMDLSRAQPAEKKKILTEFQDKFATSLTQIYDATLQTRNWIGSDIWGFFKKQVDTYCVREDSRNIIVILTDGYIFHAQNKVKDGDNYSYILPQTLSNPNSGLIVSRQGLEDLEVLILEVNPMNPTQQGQMENILMNWFSGMGVQKFYVGETDLPSNTKLIIDKFMKEKE